MVGLVVHHSILSQTFAFARLLVGMTHRYSDDGDHSFGALQQLGYLARVVVDGSEVAEPQPFGFSGHTDILRTERGIDKGGDEPQKVAVRLVALIDTTILMVAGHVGADGEP